MKLLILSICIAVASAEYQQLGEKGKAWADGLEDKEVDSSLMMLRDLQMYLAARGSEETKCKMECASGICEESIRGDWMCARSEDLPVAKENLNLRDLMMALQKLNTRDAAEEKQDLALRDLLMALANN